MRPHADFHGIPNMSACDHKFVNSKHCLKCGISFAELEAESIRESRSLNEPPAVPEAPAQMPEGWRFNPVNGGVFAGHDLVISLLFMRTLLATQGLSIIGTEELKALEAYRAMVLADNADAREKP